MAENGVYSAKVKVETDDGTEVIKSCNEGYSTFFPDSWDESKILSEVEHAISNNDGFVSLVT